MDKTISEIFKTFNHIAREIQIYCLSGFMILLNAVALDHFYRAGSGLRQIPESKLSIFVGFILSYVLGHVCMAFYYAILERTKFEGALNKLLGFEFENLTQPLPELYIKNRKVYMHFLERYVLLTLMRWTLSAAFLLVGIVNTIALFHYGKNGKVLAITICAYLLAAGFYLLTLGTDVEKQSRIRSLKDLPAPKDSAAG